MLANIQLFITPSTISILTHASLCTQQGVMCTAHSSNYPPDNRVGSRQRSDNIHIHRCSGMVTMVQEERCATSSPIPSIVHSKFTTRQLHTPVILSRVNEMLQHILQRSVSTLSLSVCLWVQCSGRTLSNSQILARELQVRSLSQSDIRNLGIPCSLNFSLTKIQANSSPCHHQQGAKCIILLSRSTNMWTG